jgi:hypothetical protein
MLFLGGVGFVFVVLPVPLVAAFTHDPAVAENAVRALRIISSGFPFYATRWCWQSFQDAGDTLAPTIINLFCFWLWELPVLHWLTLPAWVHPASSGRSRLRIRHGDRERGVVPAGPLAAQEILESRLPGRTALAAARQRLPKR